MSPHESCHGPYVMNLFYKIVKNKNKNTTTTLDRKTHIFTLDPFRLGGFRSESGDNLIFVIKEETCFVCLFV